jgi:hypothetical protein
LSPLQELGAYLYRLDSASIEGSIGEGVKMANKEQKSNANTKKEAKLTLKEKRAKKQEKKEKNK